MIQDRCGFPEEGVPRVQSPLEEGGADVNAKDKDNETPLHYAADCGELQVLKLLLDAGARTDIVSDWGETAYDVAHERGYNDCCQSLHRKG